MELRKTVRLLVVDGEPEYQRHLKEIIDLCSHQYEITCAFADSGRQAREMVHDFAPSVVLVDVHADDTDSLELLRGCNELSVPVVATAELKSREVEEQARKSGAVAFVPRTDDPEELESVLHTLAHVAGDVVVRH